MVTGLGLRVRRRRELGPGHPPAAAAAAGLRDVTESVIALAVTFQVSRYGKQLIFVC